MSICRGYEKYTAAGKREAASCIGRKSPDVHRDTQTVQEDTGPRLHTSHRGCAEGHILARPTFLLFGQNGIENHL